MSKLFLSILLTLLVTVISITAESVVDFKNWAEGYSLYYFTGGYPEINTAESFSDNDIPPKAFKPWTTQIRASGFAVMSASTLIGVNSGFPLLLNKGGRITDINRSTARSFREKTAGLTSGTVFSNSDTVFFHYYKDSLFSGKNDKGTDSGDKIEADGAEGPRTVLLELDAGAGSGDDFNIRVPEFGFADENPGWEPVELIRKDESYLIAWKYSDDKKTRFRYIRHDEDGVAVDEINEDFFRDEYALESIESGSFALRGFIRAARSGAAGDRLADAGDIYLRLSTAGQDEAAPVFYTSPNPKDGSSEHKLPVQLSACQNGDYWYVLSEDEVLFCGSDIRRLQLPDMPQGFKYKKIYVSGSDMVLSWEEERFPFTGRAGLMYVALRDIFNGE